MRLIPKRLTGIDMNKAFLLVLLFTTPVFAQSNVEFGFNFFKQGNYPEAKREFKLALESSPTELERIVSYWCISFMDFATDPNSAANDLQAFISSARDLVEENKEIYSEFITVFGLQDKIVDASAVISHLYYTKHPTYGTLQHPILINDPQEIVSFLGLIDCQDKQIIVNPKQGSLHHLTVKCSDSTKQFYFL